MTLDLDLAERVFVEASERVGRRHAIRVLLEWAAVKSERPKPLLQRRPTPEVSRHLDIVSAKYRVQRTFLLGDYRTSDVVRARDEAFARVKSLGYSLNGVARFFGKDHASVHAGLKRFAAREPGLARELGLRVEDVDGIDRTAITATPRPVEAGPAVATASEAA